MNLDMEVDDGVSEQQQAAISCGSYFLLLPSFYPILFLSFTLWGMQR